MHRKPSHMKHLSLNQKQLSGIKTANKHSNLRANSYMDEELLQELIGGEEKRQFNDLVKEEVTLQMGPLQESVNQLNHRVQVSSL